MGAQNTGLRQDKDGGAECRLPTRLATVFLLSRCWLTLDLGVRGVGEGWVLSQEIPGATREESGVLCFPGDEA